MLRQHMEDDPHVDGAVDVDVEVGEVRGNHGGRADMIPTVCSVGQVFFNISPV